MTTLENILKNRLIATEILVFRNPSRYHRSYSKPSSTKTSKKENGSILTHSWSVERIHIAQKHRKNRKKNVLDHRKFPLCALYKNELLQCESRMLHLIQAKTRSQYVSDCADSKFQPYLARRDDTWNVKLSEITWYNFRSELVKLFRLSPHVVGG